MRLFACAIALLFLAPSPAASETFSGEWIQMNWEGIMPVDGGKCLIAHTSERRYDLNPRAGSPNELYGNFVAIDWYTLLRASGPCMLEGQPVQGTQMRARVWALDGYRDNAYARVSGKWDRCLGIGCDNPQLYRQPFTTGLTLEDGGLTDRDEGKDCLSWRFHRAEWHNARVAEVQAANEAMIATALSGTPQQVRQIYATHRIQPGLVDARLADLPLMRQSLQAIVSRSSIDSRVVDATPAQRALGFDRFAVLVYQANRADGTKLPEVTVLQTEAGQWKVLP